MTRELGASEPAAADHPPRPEAGPAPQTGPRLLRREAAEIVQPRGEKIAKQVCEPADRIGIGIGPDGRERGAGAPPWHGRGAYTVPEMVEAVERVLTSLEDAFGPNLRHGPALRAVILHLNATERGAEGRS